MIEVIQPGRGNTYLLESDLSLTVTVNGTGHAYVDRYRTRALIDQTTLNDNQSQTFGPYNFDLTFVVNATGCPVSVSKQEALQALGTADA